MEAEDCGDSENWTLIQFRAAMLALECWLRQARDGP